ASIQLFNDTLPTTSQRRPHMPTLQEMIAAARTGIQCLNKEEAAARAVQEGVLVVDVREPDEHAQGAVPGAVNIPRGVLEFKIAEHCPDNTRTILIHCGGGGRASLAAESLKKLGYENVCV